MSEPPRPQLAEVQCSRLQFQPGDRILVKVFRKLDREQIRKLRKQVEQWSGGVAEVAIIDTTLMDVEVWRGDERIK